MFNVSILVICIIILVICIIILSSKIRKLENELYRIQNDRSDRVMENKEYTPGLRVPIPSTKIDLFKEYSESKNNGICSCKHPLSIFPGPGLEYCCKCNKVIT